MEGIFTFCKYKACLHCEFLHTAVHEEWMSAFLHFVYSQYSSPMWIFTWILKYKEKLKSFLHSLYCYDCVQCVLTSEWLMKAVTDLVNSQNLSLVWVLLYTFKFGIRLKTFLYWLLSLCISPVWNTFHIVDFKVYLKYFPIWPYLQKSFTKWIPECLSCVLHWSVLWQKWW